MNLIEKSKFAATEKLQHGMVFIGLYQWWTLARPKMGQVMEGAGEILTSGSLVAKPE